MCVCVCVCVSVCLSVCVVYMCACVSVFECVYTSICAFMYVYTCVHVSVSGSLCKNLHLQKHICTYIHTYPYSGNDEHLVFVLAGRPKAHIATKTPQV